MPTDNRGPELEGVLILFLILSIIAVGLRIYVRAVMLKSFGLDDWLAAATLLGYIMFSGFALQAVTFGAGRRLNHVSMESVSEILKCRLLGEVFYVITSVLVKYTVGVLLLRIVTSRWQKILIWVVLGVVLAFNIFYVAIVIFQCSPPKYYWLRILGTATGVCLPNALISNTAYVGSAINAWADWMLGLLPVIVVWKLPLRRRDKLLLAFILGLGSIACSATIVRMFYVWQLTNAKDFLYEFTDIAIWSTVENGLGLTASSMATLRPLARKILSHYRRAGSENDPALTRDIPLCKPVFPCQRTSSDVGPGVVEDGQTGNPGHESDRSGPSSITDCEEGRFKSRSGACSAD